MEKTRNYSMFKFRPDNREKIDKVHVKKLVDSISAKNLLEFRPIVLNEKMEIIDGQHRLEAAKILGVEIYYEVKKNLKSEDIITFNVQKNWTLSDYLNFYCKNGNENYIQLKEFTDKNEFALRLALQMSSKRIQKNNEDFKAGKFIFNEEIANGEVIFVKKIVDYIRKMNGFSSYVESGKFWLAAIKMYRHVDFDEARWWNNFSRFVGRFSAKASHREYCDLFMDAFNWRAAKKIDISE
jgi:hypothetical protein